MSCQVLLYQPLHVHEDPENNWRVPFKIQFFAHFSLVSLSVHPRSRWVAERIRQGEGRWSRPPKDSARTKRFDREIPVPRIPYWGRDEKKSDQIPVPSKKIVIIYICMWREKVVKKRKGEERRVGVQCFRYLVGQTHSWRRYNDFINFKGSAWVPAFAGTHAPDRKIYTISVFGIYQVLVSQ